MRQRPFDPLFFGVGATLLVLDQITKAIITAWIGPGAERHHVEIVGDWIRLNYTTNTGAAFGIGQNRSSLFLLVAIVAIPAIWYFNQTITPRNRLTRICLGALLGGALGNLIDRVRLGHVVDFVDVGIDSLRWPAFNVADSSFVIGVIVLTLFTAFAKGGEQHAADEDVRLSRSV